MTGKNSREIFQFFNNQVKEFIIPALSYLGCHIRRYVGHFWTSKYKTNGKVRASSQIQIECACARLKIGY